MKFAEVHYNKVACIFESGYNYVPDSTPPYRFWVNLENEEVKPSEGWIYEQGLFRPPNVTINFHSVITAKEFWRRFTAVEKEKIVGSTATKVKLLLTEIQMTGEANLDAPLLISLLDSAAGAGLITEDRKVEILTKEPWYSYD